MADEELTLKKQEKAESILDELKKAKTELDESIRISDEKIAELRELRANEILAGKTDAGQKQEKPKEETPAEYAIRMMTGNPENK
mgnify:CR=1 FL=1